jgi:hypothetical protein
MFSDGCDDFTEFSSGPAGPIQKRGFSQQGDKNLNVDLSFAHKIKYFMKTSQKYRIGLNRFAVVFLLI